jgi:hypothetical protein
MESSSQKLLHVGQGCFLFGDDSHAPGVGGNGSGGSHRNARKSGRPIIGHFFTLVTKNSSLLLGLGWMPCST